MHGRNHGVTAIRSLLTGAALLLVFYIPEAVNAQGMLSVSYEAAYDGNVFSNYEKLKDLIHRPELTLGWQRASTRFRAPS